MPKLMRTTPPLRSARSVAALGAYCAMEFPRTPALPLGATQFRTWGIQRRVSLAVATIVRPRQATMRWATTVILLINHVQTLATIRSLNLEWPASFKIVVDGLLNLYVVNIPGLACVIRGPQVDANAFTSVSNVAANRYTSYTCVAIILVLQSLLAVKMVASRRKMGKRAAQAELARSIVFLAQFVFTWRLIEDWALGTAQYVADWQYAKGEIARGRASFWQELSGYFRTDDTATPAAACVASLLALELHLLVHYTRLMHSYSRGRVQSGLTREQMLSGKSGRLGQDSQSQLKVPWLRPAACFCFTRSK
eukprot:972732-Prymnesium_polylepis.1